MYYRVKNHLRFIGKTIKPKFVQKEEKNGGKKEEREKFF